jgi:Flp pilus assembly protein TadG
MWLRRLIYGQTRDEGQSLLETAVAMPLLLSIAFNIINLSYCWFMVLSLSAAPRQAVQFSAQGGLALTTTSAPMAAMVSTVAYDNMTNAVHGATTGNTSVRVCSATVGPVNSKTNIAQCSSFGPGFSFPANTADPEAPVFVLNRVDVEYTVTPPIPGTVFNVVLPPQPMNFQRHVSMRSLFP